jgi:cyclophilin family peptidyl-prolyl cis-trans isomerase
MLSKQEAEGRQSHLNLMTIPTLFFGQLIEGLDVLEKIGNVEVDEKWIGPDKKIAVHKPKIPVIIKKASLKTPS